jgi:hypothetical protein
VQVRPRHIIPSEARSARHDAELVSIDARLLEASEGPQERVFSLQADNLIFNARLDASGADGGAPGSVLRVTGICSVKSDRNGTARSFELLLRSPSDLVVVQNPPWWTIERMIGILGALIAAVVGQSRGSSSCGGGRTSNSTNSQTAGTRSPPWNCDIEN